eukprot:jgi/Psemu1/197491/e_gw1.205.84.1
MFVRSIAISSVALLLAGHSSAFQQSQTGFSGLQSSLAFSYLEELAGSENSFEAVPAAKRSNWGYWPGPSGSSSPAAAAAPEPAPAVVSEGEPAVHHAPLDYFSLDQLVSKGPRATKDWGTPQDATRKLANDGMLTAGAWYCSEGGWPSPNPKAHTEIFYVLDGHGVLGDADGAKHYFGPGDTVIIPKGHTGRWDVTAPIHKIWAVNTHDYIEETDPIIRVRVDGYHTFAPHLLTRSQRGIDPLYGAGAPEVSYKTIYDIGPTTVGVWASDRAFIPVTAPLPRKSFFFLLEGSLNVHNIDTGTSQRCEPGDTVMLPEGFTGYIDVLEPAKKLFTTVV